ncbi:tetratricopeptide repeat protein [Leptospira santarosai]|uniref:tetratricopeptide repeat protein n=1 Tax=Leptospira santarosai TaxID=28183 RepID=UPI0024AEE0E0|nr:tetratricopeptide repeat protein [Leptospira santarosai]MDI7219135.1 tetratricopeptide repeat protein [Leptospira santarosai]
MNIVITVLSVILLFSCNKAESNKYLVDKYALAKGENKDQMAKAFEFEKTGLTFYKNKKYTDAISAYEQALDVYATGSIYYNYGNSLWNIGNLDLAIRSYEIAELLNYERKDLLYYNLACAYSLKNQKETALTYLDKAVKNGYKNLNYFFEDADLKPVLGTEGWQRRAYLISAGKQYFLSQILNLKKPISLRIATDTFTLCPGGHFMHVYAAGVGQDSWGNWEFHLNKLTLNTVAQTCFDPKDNARSELEGYFCKGELKECKDGACYEDVNEEHELPWERIIEEIGPPLFIDEKCDY